MNEKSIYPHDDPQWDGYTLDELRYQKALSAARLEIQKERFMAQVNHVRNAVNFAKPTGIVGRIFSSLSYVDYGLIAFRLIKKTTSLIKSIRRK